MRNDEVRQTSTTKQPHLSAIVQAMFLPVQPHCANAK